MGLIVNQALHGYSDGHRLISGSLSLPSTDARIMVVMSDLSGPGVKPDEFGYLTGYPLEGAGKYVLARTWAAPEMPRPGCVWTHSLIIDNADLASLTSVESLLAVFQKPRGPAIKSNYSVPAEVSKGVIVTRPIQIDRVRALLTALYAAPERAIVAGADQSIEDEHIITAIWMQQWPRLRRSFGFCTLAGMDRSAKGVALDLQLVRSADRQAKAKFPTAVTPGDVAAEPVLESLVADIKGTDTEQIREFLRRTGGDVEGGRRAMLPLCKLHSSLFSHAHPNLAAAVSALDDLDALGNRQARSVRTLVARRALDEVENVGDEVFDFIVETMEQGLQPNEQPIIPDRVGMALWRRSPARFQEAIDGGGVLGEASLNALSLLSPSELVSGLQTYPLLARRVTSARPELLESADLWRIPGIDEDIAADNDAGDAGRVAAALVKAGKFRSAPAVIARANPADIAAVLAESASEPVLNAWLHATMANPSKAAGVLASGRISSRDTIVAMARVSGPDAIPNDYGDDPWLIAMKAARKPFDQRNEDFLAAFMMARALGQRSKSQAELMQFAYTTLYRALQQDRLTAEVHRIATSRLDSGGWLTWDNPSRLKETVVARFIDRHLNPEIFGQLSDDGTLTFSLIDEAANTARGRRYLSEVRKRLKDSNKKGMKARADYIARKIK